MTISIDNKNIQQNKVLAHNRQVNRCNGREYLDISMQNFIHLILCMDSKT